MAISLVAAVLHGLLRGEWFRRLLAGISLTMPVLPEDFTPIPDIFLTQLAQSDAGAPTVFIRCLSGKLGGGDDMALDKTGDKK